MKFEQKAFSIGKLFIVALWALTNPSPSQANVYGLPPCTESLSYDSFAISQFAGLTDENGLPVSSAYGFDRQCLSLGISAGQALRAQNLFGGSLSVSCRTDLRLGESAGMEQNGLTGSDCFRAGYQYGVAQLDIGAREGVSSLVGPGCVEQYRRGVRDGSSLRFNDTMSPSFANERDRHCYNLGVYEHASISR